MKNEKKNYCGWYAGVKRNKMAMWCRGDGAGTVAGQGIYIIQECELTVGENGWYVGVERFGTGGPW